ncbi:MAG: hypothetical protein PHC53_04330 [Patescibacteria group bacterium]|nr:hypothetical protein [Patescibacteria group bacterium]
MPTSHQHNHLSKCAYVVSVNMGYGHERAAYGLKEIAHGGIITANDYPGIPKKDKKLWIQSRKGYEAISRLKPIPIIGDVAFAIMDKIQKIPDFYPRRDLSKETYQVMQTYYMIEHLHLCKDLIDKLAKKPLPLVCTFFIPAFAAEVFEYPGDIYCVLCDADVSRAWVAKDPKKSRIKYFAPNGRIVERLKLYGVREENIYLTGFPLPKEAIGDLSGNIIRKDMMARFCNLDPNGIFLKKYQRVIQSELGSNTCEIKRDHPLTVMFTVGGAGAQKQLGIDILSSLKRILVRDGLRLRLVAGTKKEIAENFYSAVKKLKITSLLGKKLFIDYHADRPTYFREFTKQLRKTDILWTKPSEMSFYCGMGLPIIMAPTIGSQEDFNRTWLMYIGAGIDQGDPKYTNEWLFDWIASGGIARAAWNGYMEAPQHGAYRIEGIITGTRMDVETLPMIV